MPSKSKSQQRFFGMVDAYKKGEMKNPSAKIKKAAKNMTKGEVEDFASTKHKGLPNKVDESRIKRIVRESVSRILKEAESEGWIVEADEAQEAYNLAAQVLGEETINAAIVRAMGDETLAECLAYIFRQYDFREWKSKYE